MVRRASRVRVYLLDREFTACFLPTLPTLHQLLYGRNSPCSRWVTRSVSIRSWRSCIRILHTNPNTS